MGSQAPASDARRAMDEVVVGLQTKSAKIRALDSAGYTRSQIADFLGVSYQHVRQVLVTAKPNDAARAVTAPSVGSGDAEANSAMNEVVAGLRTKASKIRALAAAGYSRPEIARFLGIRYQHVRNVLVQQPPAKAEGPPGETSRQVRAPIGPGGRLAVPAEYWRALGVGEGDKVVVELAGDDEIRIMTARSALGRARHVVRKYVRSGVSLVDDLLAERRREAKSDERRR